MINPEDRNAMTVRKLSMQANMLNLAMAELWHTYQDLFHMIDLDDPVGYDKTCDAIIELDANLSSILGEIREQQDIMCGFFEPRPNVEGLEDFESSVLRGIADLDNMDLSVYSTDDDEGMGWDDPETGDIEKVPTKSMTPEEMLEVVRKQYYGR